MGGWTDGCRRRLNSGNKKKRQKKPKGFYARLLLSFNFLNIDGKKKKKKTQSVFFRKNFALSFLISYTHFSF